MSVAVRPAAVDASPTFPRRGGWATTTLVALASGLLASVVALWFVHDGVADLGDGWVAASSSFTRITGLLASVAGLVGLGLLTRPRNLERSVGLDTIFIWHRRLGATTAILVGARVTGAIVNASATVGPINALLDLTGREAYMATATVGAVLIGVVTVSSIASVRRRLSYETWYFVHLTAYLGLALAFSHQIFVGTDLAGGAWTSAAWIAVNLGIVAAVVWGRWGRLVAAAARSLRVTAVDAVGPDTTTLWLSGPRADEGAEPGQFYLLRPLRPRACGGTRTRTRCRRGRRRMRCASRSSSVGTPVGPSPPCRSGAESWRRARTGTSRRARTGLTPSRLRRGRCRDRACASRSSNRSNSGASRSCCGALGTRRTSYIVRSSSEPSTARRSRGDRARPHGPARDR